MRPALIPVLCLLPLVARAAEPAPAPGHQAFVPAPVPSLGPPAVQPSERAGGPGLASSNAGPADSNPFSGQPSATLRQGSQLGQHARETAPGGLVSTPSLNK
jgi:hypothetical protein